VSPDALVPYAHGLCGRNVKFLSGKGFRCTRLPSRDSVTLFHLKKCEPGWIRTIDTIIKSDVLYQAELRAQKILLRVHSKN
jgi:hypothetical protein